MLLNHKLWARLMKLNLLSDLVFILLFPHLLLVVHFPHRTNKYGMVMGFSIALLLRVLSGEPVLKYNAIIKWEGYVEPFTEMINGKVSQLYRVGG